jgi:putative tricarboxylic transport membrane protein
MAHSAWTPAHEVEIVAGTPPGGGVDRAARALAAAMEATHLVAVPIKVVNQGGDGGRNCWRYVERFAGDGHVIGVSSPNLTTDFLTGSTSDDPDRYSPLAILYNEYIAFVARSDSAYGSGADLVQRLAKDAASVTFAVSTSIGNPNHIAAAKVMQHVGANTKAPKIRVFDTALDAVADVVAGRSDVGAVTAASAVKELDVGTLHTIGVSSPERLPGVFAVAPTWTEQKVECVVGAWRGVSGPSGLSAAQIAWWQEALAPAMATAEWHAACARHFWTPMFIAGQALRDYLPRERAEMTAILRDLGLLRS